MNNTYPYKKNLQIDLNCDMGEGMDNEALIMPFISSVNIACGYHAGNEYTIKKTIELAVQNGVAIGAHPSYEDLENFGRTSQNLSLLDIAELIADQVYIFEKIAEPLGQTIHHIKLHGALYNDCAKDPAKSKIVIETIQAINPDMYIYGLSGSFTIQQALLHGQPFMNEVFADRTYLKDGSLTPRQMEGALIDDIPRACKQVVQMIQEKKVTTLFDEIIPIQAETICIHGDGYHAIEMAKAIHQTLKENQIEIKFP